MSESPEVSPSNTLAVSSETNQAIPDDAYEDMFDVVNEGSKRKFICKVDDCQKVFRYKSEIQRHIAAHSTHRPHTCTFDGCDKSFKRADALENHVRSQHTGEAPLACPYKDCGQHFTTDAKLRYHIALHTGEKPYKCSIPDCKRSFLTLSQLKQHEKSISVHKNLSKVSNRNPGTENEGRLPSPLMRTKSEDSKSKSAGTPEKKLKVDIDTKDSQEAGLNLNVSARNTELQNLYKVFNQVQAQLQLSQIQEEQQVFTSEKLKVLEQIVGENDTLRSRLQGSERLIEVIKGQLGQIVLALPEETRQLILNNYSPGFGLTGFTLSSNPSY